MAHNIPYFKTKTGHGARGDFQNRLSKLARSYGALRVRDSAFGNKGDFAIAANEEHIQGNE